MYLPPEADTSNGASQKFADRPQPHGDAQINGDWLV